jgi:hypothetical protein
MRRKKRLREYLVTGLLFLGLAGVLIVNLGIVIDLPARVYTPAQLEYLDYNRGRSISQVAPTLNIITPEGVSETAILSYVRESRVRAILAARYEEYESVSATVYDLDFRGEYRLVYDGSRDTTVQLYFPFPGNLETLHEVSLQVDGEEPPGVEYTTDGIRWQTVLPAGEEHRIGISYLADGASAFGYRLYHNQRADVDVSITVAGLTGSRVPRSSLPTTAREVTEDGEILTWNYSGLVADRDIHLALPTRQSFAQRMAQMQNELRILARLAPVLVGGFLASLAVVFRLRRVRLQTESYLLAGCGFALFFPLLAFLSGIVGLVPAAIAALLIVSGLMVTFLGRLSGWRGTGWWTALLLVIFLGFFSLGMLTPWQGLLVTSGGLLLVGTFMWLYARRLPDSEAGAPGAPPEVASGREADPQPEEGSPELEAVLHDEPDQDSEPALLAQGAGWESDLAQPGTKSVLQPAAFHCPYCARVLADDYRF